jgi:hypothetical protein
MLAMDRARAKVLRGKKREPEREPFTTGSEVASFMKSLAMARKPQK